MPIYEYRCKGCGQLTEVFGQTEALAQPPEKCVCGQEQSFYKIFSTFAAHSANTSSMPDNCCGSGACESTGGCGCGMAGCGH